MKNTAIIILLAMLVMAVVYTATDQVPVKPPIPTSVSLPMSVPFTPPPMTLPPLPGNLTNSSSHMGTA